MILGSKHVGAILNFKQFYLCALVGVLIECLYEMHGATIKKIYINAFCAHLHRYPHTSRCIAEAIYLFLKVISLKK